MKSSARLPIFAGMEERFAPIGGSRLRYLVGGSGPPLVLLHGIVASSFSFRFTFRELGRHFRLFVPDLRIVGVDGGLAATASLLVQLLDQAQIDRADILGSSHGGSVAMELAAQAPDRLRRMILVSPANPYAENYKKVVSFYLSPLGGIFIRMAPMMPVRLWEYGIGRMCAFPKSLAAGTGIGYREPLRITGATQQIRSTLKSLNVDIAALLPKLQRLAGIPSILIWGDLDPVVEMESGYRLQQTLQSKLAIMPGVGHLPYEENPAEFNRIVLEFLK
ncbi:MAG TPA: alpha/beta hydrolase [Terriglobales bacterium]|nr:alpha/beta hydrolase [Terriglobales bacterium]